MAEVNPLAVIAECIDKCTATADQRQIAHYLADALGELQIDNTEADAFNMLGGAVADTAAKDGQRSADLLRVWRELEAGRNKQ